MSPNHAEVNLNVASFDKLAVVSLAATKGYIYLWIQVELFICLYVLLMYMYVHFLEIKYQSIKWSISRKAFHVLTSDHALQTIVNDTIQNVQRDLVAWNPGEILAV